MTANLIWHLAEAKECFAPFSECYGDGYGYGDGIGGDVSNDYTHANDGDCFGDGAWEYRRD